MDKNSLFCSRVSARLVVHPIRELQLTAPLQKNATKFYNHQVPIFPPDFSKISERFLPQVLCPCVVVEKPL